MATLDELVVRIRADASQLERELKKASSSTEQAGRKIGASMDSARKSVGSLGTQLTALAGLLAGGKLVGTITTFEKINASLRTVTGSAENAASAFEMIQAFAAKTPFSVQEVAQAFIKLKALGLEPGEEALRSYGNTATAMGKSLDQMVEAVADAVTGEFERLKTFGIRTQDAGDSVVFTFQGMATKVRKNAGEIEDYLRRIGDVNFAKAIDEQQGTLTAALSNMGDGFAALAQAIGDAGLTELLTDIANAIQSLTKTAAAEIPKIRDQFNILRGSFGSVSAGGLYGESAANMKKIGQSQFRLANLRADDSWLVKDDVWGLDTRENAIKAEQARLQTLLNRQTEIGIAISGIPYNSDEDLADDNQTGGGRNTASFGKSASQKKAKEAEDYDAAGDALSDYLAKQQQEIELSGLSGKALAERRAELEANNIAIKGGSLLTAEMSETVRANAAALYEAEEAQKKLSEAQQEVIRFQGELKDKFSDTLSSIVLDFDNAADAAKRFALAVAQMVVEKKLTGPLADSLGSALDGIDFGGFFADGGNPPVGIPSIVGEKGPEVFVPRTQGTIVPNHALGGQSIVVNHTWNVSPGIQGTVRAELMNSLPGIVSASKGAVIDALNKGGAESRMFGKRG